MPPRGKKFNKPTRGGGKHYSRDLKPLDDGGEIPGMWDGRQLKEDDDDDSNEEGSGEEEEEEESEDEAGPSSSSAAKSKAPVITSEMTREERKAAQKARKDAIRAQKAAEALGKASLSDDEEEEEEKPAKKAAPPAGGAVPAGGFKTNNPNFQQNTVDQPAQLTRREREAIEAAAAKERYRKLHEAGKTDEAKADLARLAQIRAEREEKAKQRKAELEEKKRIAEVKAAESGRRKR